MVKSFLESFEALHSMWRHGLGEEAQRKLPWHSRPKAHMLQHLADQKIDMYGSPSRFWCYGDEDFVGTIKTVCMMTKHPHTLERRVAEKAMISEGVNRYRLVHG